MTITALPTPPNRSMVQSAFTTAADAFLAALPQMVTDINAASANIDSQVALAAGYAATTPSSSIGTSTTAVTIPSTTGGSLSWTYVEAARALTVGQFVLVAVTASPTANYVLIQVTAWNSGTKQVTGKVITYQGAGTFSAWSLSQSGPQGAAGANGIGSGSFTPAGGSVTLTNTSPSAQSLQFTAQGQYVRMPDSTTMANNGSPIFTLVNNTQFFGRVLDMNNKLIGVITPGSVQDVSLLDKTAQKWAVAGSPMYGVSGAATFSGAALGSTTPTMLPVRLDSTRTLVLVGGTSLYGAVYDKSTGTWGSATLLATPITLGAFAAIKSAAGQVLLAFANGTAFTSKTLTVTGTTIAANTAVTATLSAAAPASAYWNIVQLDATPAYLLVYSRGGVVAAKLFTVAGTVPSMGADATISSTISGTPSNPVVFTSGTQGLYIGQYSAVPFTWNSGTLAIAVGTAVTTLNVSSPTQKAAAFGSRWLTLGVNSTPTAVGGSLISVSANVATVSSLSTIFATTASTMTSEYMDIQIVGSKALVMGNTGSGTQMAFALVTDNAGTASVGTTVTHQAASANLAGWYAPVFLGSSGTDAYVLFAGEVLKISCAGANPVITGVNYGFYAWSPALDRSQIYGAISEMYTGQRNARYLYTGNGMLVPIAVTSGQTDSTPFMVATNTADAVSVRHSNACACASSVGIFTPPAAFLLKSFMAPTDGTPTESWLINLDASSGVWSLTLFEGIQP